MTTVWKIVGYDPGGNNSHGVAALLVVEGKPTQISFSTVQNAEAALQWFTTKGLPNAAGIDTLTVLSTGDSGWRPADRWLRSEYPEVRNSVVNSNFLQGAMALNGFAVIKSLQQICESILISETHPKVLYYRLSGYKYDYLTNRIDMNNNLTKWTGLTINTTNNHEWDAVISCYAVLEGMLGNWTYDLHRRPPAEGESLVELVGPSHYYWPNLIK
jgi:hypothetical protein